MNNIASKRSGLRWISLGGKTMRLFVFFAVLFGGVSAFSQQLNLSHFVPVVDYLNGWFGSFDPRQAADDSKPGELAVHRLLLAGDSWCSTVMIGPQWAVTAAHCIYGKPYAVQFYRDNYVESTISVDHTWHGRFYGQFWNVGSIKYLYQDYGFVHLRSPAPKWVRFADIAQPNEVYVGERAKSVGFPKDRFGGDTKVRAEHCSVRRLVNDSILSDCAISEGNSGGALFVFTPSGEWKLGGVTSTEIGYNKNDVEYMIRGGAYSDDLANHFVNISFYTGHIAKSIAAYDSEKLPTLAASLTYPVRCLTRFTDIRWPSINEDEINACELVHTQPQLNCLSQLFQKPAAMTTQNYQMCLK